LLLGGDDVSSGETDSQSQREVTALIQKLLLKATHPSPAKVITENILVEFINFPRVLVVTLKNVFWLLSSEPRLSYN
jgi:hypothetical protein